MFSGSADVDLSVLSTFDVVPPDGFAPACADFFPQPESIVRRRTVLKRHSLTIQPAENFLFTLLYITRLLSRRE